MLSVYCSGYTAGTSTVSVLAESSCFCSASLSKCAKDTARVCQAGVQRQLVLIRLCLHECCVHCSRAVALHSISCQTMSGSLQASIVAEANSAYQQRSHLAAATAVSGPGRVSRSH